MKNLALLLTGALLVLNTQVFAADAPQQAAPRPQKMLKQFDTNKDGQVSRDEFATKRATGFARFDSNKDGNISLAEFKASCKNERCTQSKTKQFAKLDKNSDGNIAKDEFANMKMFDRLDVNKDGYLSEDELPTMKKSNKMGKGDSSGKAPPEGMRDGMKQEDAPKPMPEPATNGMM